ncbi:recombinase family protein [Paracoccus marinaquae]|uniref:Recombinase family protein n=1 Tax=Paracoccus marinaquae TaxID=2841926 RepID=A0ABS6AJ08_9RHOB|nr:recombinase family protein [Paracoccus marinaquae]MBU3029376.1 recombinase family protein [Paracoccus marinaquae]
MQIDKNAVLSGRAGPGPGSGIPGYVIYTRVGDEDLGRVTVCLAAQEHDIAAFVAEREEYDIAGRFSDREAGSGNAHDGLRQALCRCHETGAALLISRLDRLPIANMGLAPFFDDPQIALRVAVLPGASPDELRAHARLGEQERRCAASRAADNLRKSRSWSGAPETSAPDRTEQVARIALPMRENGATLHDIAMALNRAGLTTPRGSAWRPAQVSRILQRMT